MMKETFTRAVKRATGSFAAFTTGQKVVAVVGTAALLLAGFMVFRWAATPSYAPLFSNLASEDASAIIDELDASGVPYQLSDGGNTIMVPRDQVYATRIRLSGEGLPSASDGGYSLLDTQSISTSQFQEQTSFKRAMEGELSNTIEAIDGVDTAVVHLAMPEKRVFADQQDPTTASVLVKTTSGTMQPEQVQAVVNLVAASIDGLEESNVTVADSTGKVLSAPGGTLTGATGQNQQVTDFQNAKTNQVQAMLDRIFGAGNATVQVTADLSFDKTVSDTTRYFGNADKALSATEESEILEGGDASALAGANGVVGPEGQTEPNGTGTGTGQGQNYTKTSKTSDNAVNSVIERREAAPGSVESLHVGVVIDTRALKGADLGNVQTMIASALGVDRERGDTIDVSSLPFDRTAETAAAEELAAAAAAEEKAGTTALIRNGGIAGVVAIMLAIAWLRSRKRAKARAEATEYVVEQLRRDSAERQATQAALEAPAALLALESAENAMANEAKDEIAALVEAQPEDVAALLRGWLVDRGA